MNRLSKPLFFLGWLLINLFQAFATELLDDEAYYWIYSQFIDWGYYDHPPMIALLIKWGYAFQAGELGVRLFIVLMSTATIMLIDQLLPKKDDPLFYALSISILLLQIGGIIAVPDVPLMFFIALYFLVLRHFIEKPSLLKSIVLGLLIALMLYSKYHGILIVVFTLAAYPRLLRIWHTWTAAGIAAILFLPHILWQFLHGLPSVSYHLFERNASEYKFSFTAEFIGGQLALAGPFIGWLVIMAAFRQPASSPFTRVLRWTTIGIYTLFTVATLKGRAEANWTAPAFIGLVVLSHQWLSEHRQWRKWAFVLLWPALIVSLVVRIYTMMDVEPRSWLKKDEFHKNKDWATAIRSKADGLPVVFINSYQRASKYWFYSGDTSFSLNSVHYRRNNFNFWPLEERLQGKKVIFVHDVRSEFFTDSLPNKKRPMFTHVTDSFFSYSQMKIEEVGTAEWNGKTLRILLRAQLQKGRSVRSNTRIYLALYNEKNKVSHLLETTLLAHSILDESAAGVAQINFDGITPGTYRYKWGVESCVPAIPTMNSASKKIIVP